MRRHKQLFQKTFRILASGIIVSLLLLLFPAVPAYAEGGVILYPPEGKIGTWLTIDGYSYNANKTVSVYFSSDAADLGNHIGNEVKAYELVGTVSITTNGRFFERLPYQIPDKLTGGKIKEDVHGGDYYFYVTYFTGDKRIEGYARFVVPGGKITLDKDTGQVGNEIRITGEEFRNSQKITIEYDGNLSDIAGGDNNTSGEGKFSCTTIIPPSPIGTHIITAIDESGNKAEAEFTVEPKITIAPTSVVAGNAVQVSGTGFGEREYINITILGTRIVTTPAVPYVNLRGSFDCTFVAPLPPNYEGGGVVEVEASGSSLNKAEAQLTILAAPATAAVISLSPITSLDSPGHVAMELTVEGTSFNPDTTVTITYSDNKASITVAQTVTQPSGKFSSTFSVPPSAAGNHIITANDGFNNAQSIFVMESKSPPMPLILQPNIAATTKSKAYFDWEDVTDPSGITYTLQIGTDPGFTNMVLEKKELSYSGYTVTEEEKLQPSSRGVPYYWRVKAIDLSLNESEWTPPASFYIGFSFASVSSWVWYSFYGLGILLIVALYLKSRRMSS